MSLLGPPPPRLLARGQPSHKFFSPDGKFLNDSTPITQLSTLENREVALNGEDKAEFMRLVRRMLQWKPEKRSSVISLAEDDWHLKQLKW